jgi:hypothetical protein
MLTSLNFNNKLSLILFSTVHAAAFVASECRRPSGCGASQQSDKRYKPGSINPEYCSLSIHLSGEQYSIIIIIAILLIGNYILFFVKKIFLSL